MTRRAAWIGVLMLAGIALAALTWGTVRAVAPQASVVGRPAPNVSLHSFDGRTIQLADFRGTPLVVNFWASWCVSCRTEQEVLNRAAASYSGRARFIGIDIQDSDGAARSYLRSERVMYLTATANDAMTRFGVKAPPETYFLGADGSVVTSYVGPLDDANLALYMTRISG